MVTNLKKAKLFDLWWYLKHNVHPDFYITENNRRVFVTEHKIFKKLLGQSHLILINEEGSNVNGVIMLWKGLGGTKQRSYIKISAANESVAHKLITVLLWNISKNIYVKVKKYSPYVDLFKEKSFSFLGGRGKELLLIYKYRPQIIRNDRNRRNFGRNT